ncbi:class I SAM-dependent methyltransferase [Halorhabdus sp. CBA1104]|uniref:class I SAM-dependent methyltransferase n=1 Tax=Halorhabdus sp. CBA1104 TaxID=1380432 RepID=UPI0012B209C4|nr:class I SAM-dependent methyltransferase [Halorhabdus sp. CBA1104]QGN06290.1 class I SAM-dependent methyltransferase [Halorhabdus sp. CBA1104]
MPERLYTDHPELYDAIQSEWDYDRDVSFVTDVIDRFDVDGERLLEIGCGTGEHTRRFAAAGFDVTAIDKYDGMLKVAREKYEVDFRQETLPDLTVDGAFDAIVMIRGVVNHLVPDDLQPAIDAIETRLASDGILVFDNSPLPPDGNHPALDVGTTEHGDYARLSQHVACDGRLDWRSMTVTPDGEFFVDSRPMTPFEDATIAEALREAGLTVETVGGYGPEDDRTVFVCTRA